jgi:site-specific DNA-methyltransferase (adenine-specific)
MRLGPHTILHGDCLTELPKLSGGAFDVVVTSPPYNLDLAYDAYRDSLGEQEYLDWMVQVCTAIRRVLVPDGSFFLNISGSNRSPWLPFELIVRLRRLFVLQNHITWIKSIAMAHDSVGHFKPLAGARYLNHNHEHIFHLTLDGAVKLDRLAVGVPFKDKSNIARRNHARDLRCRGNTWFIPYPTVQTRAAKFNHPGTFPVDLPLWCIRLHGKAQGRILDPFMGTGTTMIAAALAGMNATGIELDAGYFDIAAARLREHMEEAPDERCAGRDADAA